MAFIVELDAECRIKLSTAIRESLDLQPGSQVTIEREEKSGRTMLSPSPGYEEPHLVWEDRLLVIEGGPPPAMDVVDEIRWMRAKRSAHVAGRPNTTTEFLDPDYEN